MKINNTPTNTKQNNNPSFRGPLDGIITQSLITIDTNPMVNAALVDVFAMVIPRTYVDTKKRNKYAGAETLFRELTGTFIVCLSSGIIAKGLAHLYNKIFDPKTKLNPNSWVTNDGLNLLKESWDKSGGSVEKYIDNILSNISGIDGKKTSNWKDINWKNVEWIDNPKWDKIKWKNPDFKNIHNNLKSEAQITKTLSQIIGENTDRKDAAKVLDIIKHRITNALGADNSISVKISDKTLNSSLKNLIRDTYDLGKNVFTNKSVNLDTALNKLQKMNKAKTLGALAIASSLGLTNQYINRKITQKRTGTDTFVGEVDYRNFIGKNQEETPQNKKDKNKLFGLKLLASAGIIALAAAVMRIKNPKDFIKKLEFTGQVTSGNAIKTVYTATLVGRFMASKNENELRESTTRDYLGFLNWLVLGGFAAKGVANLLDKNRSNLFNIHKEGKGIGHWLNSLSLKSHAEIASKGVAFAKKNIWKVNLAHASGLLYSTLALGFLLPLLNIVITKSKHKKTQQKFIKEHYQRQGHIAVRP
ncbi:MAG: hypothetical protein WCY19_08120 [Candidatus Gastranaerophilaceae bacterium]